MSDLEFAGGFPSTQHGKNTTNSQIKDYPRPPHTDMHFFMPPTKP